MKVLVTTQNDIGRVGITAGQVGSQGTTGAQGTQGVTGAGTQGTQGTQGLIGSQGTVGTQGLIGSQGLIGTQGLIGPQGAVGTQGTLGQTGSQGLVGAKGDTGSFGGASFEYNYVTNTANTDPGSGNVGFNDSTLINATYMYIDPIDAFGSNSFNYLQTIDDSTSSIKGHFKAVNTANVNEYAYFAINGAHTHETGYFAIPIIGLDETLTGNTFANGANVTITFVRTGDKGDAGIQGIQGSIGLQGSTGTQGLFGAQGALGVQGLLGSQGLNGIQGILGSQGITGIQGAQGVQGGLNVSVGDDAPGGTPTANQDFWFESDTGRLKIWYNDGTSSQWVDVFPTTSGPQGPTGPNGSFTISNTVPNSPASGEVWWNSANGKSYIYYNDGTSSQWVLLTDPTNKGDPGANIASFTYGNSNQTLTIIDSLTNQYSARIYYPEFWVGALSDETTAITTGTKATFRAPYDLEFTEIPRASLTNVSTSGIVTVDINKNGTSILGANKLTIDQNEKTSVTATTPTSFANTTIDNDDEFTFDVDSAGTNATGLKVTLYFRRR